jgi:hypothetical protein
MATLTKGKTFTSGELVTPAAIHQLVDAATISNIVNADIAAGAAIVDSKLAQISTAGKVLPAAVQGTAVITTDSRLSDARTPTSHTHGSIPNAGAIGVTANLPVITGTSGVLQVGSFGTAANTFCKGDDSRLSDARTPSDGSVTNAKVSDLAAIADTKLAQITTAGKVANSATTATSSNSPNTIVARNNFGGVDIASITGVSPGFNSGIHNINTSVGTYIGGILTNSTNTGVIYSTSSDHRLKTDLEKLASALDRLSALPVHRFKWVGHPAAPKVDGFLAHEAQAVVPESVTGTKDAVDTDGKPIYQGIDQSKLVPLLVAAVQELAARVAALEAK